jgi:ketopantoate reductase
MRIAVVGAGAVGARLAHAGAHVVFLAFGANRQAIREHGLQADSGAGDIRAARPTSKLWVNRIRDCPAVLIDSSCLH